MPRFQVLVEYAIACDLIIDVNAGSADEAIEQAGERTSEASMMDAILSQFPGASPRISSGETLVTDLRIVNP